MAKHTTQSDGAIPCRRRKQKNSSKKKVSLKVNSKPKSQSSTQISSNTSSLKKQSLNLDIKSQLPQTQYMSSWEIGKQFEEEFKTRAKLNGLYAEKCELNARRLPGGGVKVLKSELDYKLINQAGRVGYFDCKSYAGDSFVFSQLDPNQLERADRYNYWNVPSGFVVWFRQINRIVYFSGFVVTRKGAGSSFSEEDGISLGSIENFDLKPLLR